MRTYEKVFFQPLRAKGLFVEFGGESGLPTVIVNCHVYLTDTDEGGAPTKPFCIATGEPKRGPDGRCVCCDQRVYVPTTARGSIMCPLCNSATAPWSVIQRSFRAIFQITPGEPATFLPLSYNDILPEGMRPMTNEDYIADISYALRNAADWCFTSKQFEIWGWPATQERLRAEEAASEAAAIQEARNWSSSPSWLNPTENDDIYRDMPSLISLNDYDDMPALAPISSLWSCS